MEAEAPGGYVIEAVHCRGETANLVAHLHRQQPHPELQGAVVPRSLSHLPQELPWSVSHNILTGVANPGGQRCLGLGSSGSCRMRGFSPSAENLGRSPCSPAVPDYRESWLVLFGWSVRAQQTCRRHARGPERVERDPQRTSHVASSVEKRRVLRLALDQAHLRSLGGEDRQRLRKAAVRRRGVHPSLCESTREAEGIRFGQLLAESSCLFKRSGDPAISFIEVVSGQRELCEAAEHVAAADVEAYALADFQRASKVLFGCVERPNLDQS